MITRIVALFAVLLIASPAVAENLVVNGTFRAALSGWNFGGSPLSFDPNADADDWPGSGSGRYVNDNALAQTSQGFGQCLDTFTPGAEYYFEAQLAFAALQTRSGFTQLYVFSFADPACTGPLLDQFTSPQRPTEDGRGKWFPAAIGDFESGFVIDPNAASVLVAISVSKDQPGGALTLNADNVVVAPVGERLCRGRVPTVVGTDGPDILVGTPGSDVIAGFDGDDDIKGRGGADLICGGAGHDVIRGGPGNDLIYGDGGPDDIRGNGGNDALLGGTGADTLRGGAGKDVDVGGPGDDKCDFGTGDLPNVPQCETITP